MILEQIESEILKRYRLLHQLESEIITLDILYANIIEHRNNKKSHNSAQFIQRNNKSLCKN